MSSLLVSVNAIVPVFMLIAVGYAVKKAGLLSLEEVRHFNAANFYTFMPVMLFYDIYTSELEEALRPGYVFYTLGCILVLTGLVAVITLKIEPRNDCRGVMIQGAFRSNFVLLGLPIATALLPMDTSVGPIALMIAIVVPIYNVLAVIIFETFRGGDIRLSKVCLGVVKNPLIIGAVLALVLKGLHIQLPEFLLSFASRMDKGCFAIALFLLGAAFEFNFLTAFKRDLLFIIVVRLIVFPGVALTGAALLGYRGIEFATLLALFAAPCAINSFNMALQMGGNEELAASSVMTTSALSFFTLFLWVTLFHHLGMF